MDNQFPSNYLSPEQLRQMHNNLAALTNPQGLNGSALGLNLLNPALQNLINPLFNNQQQNHHLPYSQQSGPTIAGASMPPTTSTSITNSTVGQPQNPLTWPFGINPSNLAAAAALATNPTSQANGVANQSHTAALMAALTNPPSIATTQSNNNNTSSASNNNNSNDNTNNTAATNYLSHLHNLQMSPESLLSVQQNLLLIEQLHQQHHNHHQQQHHQNQLLANPHLLMAAAAAAAATQSNANTNQAHLNNSTSSRLTSSPQTHTTNSQAQQLLHQQQYQNLFAALAAQQQHHSTNTNHLPSSISSNSLLTTTSNSNGSLPTSDSSNSDQSSSNFNHDSLVDQHFRRSLGEDYNQIIANKAVDNINGVVRNNLH